MTDFTIKGNSILQTSTLKIVLEYAHGFEQYSTRKNTHILCSGCLIYILMHSWWLLRYSLASFCDPKHSENKVLREISDN